MCSLMPTHFNILFLGSECRFTFPIRQINTWASEKFRSYASIKYSFFFLRRNRVRVCVLSSPTLCYPKDCSHQVPLTMEFSRQEYWSGLPFLLLQGIFLTQGSNQCLFCLLHWQVNSLPLCHLGSPRVCAVSPKSWLSIFLHLHFVPHLLFVLYSTARGALLTLKKKKSDCVLLLLKNIRCQLNTWMFLE